MPASAPSSVTEWMASTTIRTSRTDIITLDTRSTPFLMPKKQIRKPIAQTRIVQKVSDGRSVSVCAKTFSISAACIPSKVPLICSQQYFIIQPATVV